MAKVLPDRWNMAVETNFNSGYNRMMDNRAKKPFEFRLYFESVWQKDILYL